MVNDEELRKLREKAEEYSIVQRLQIDDWPAPHVEIFQIVEELSKIHFDAYGDDEPWKRQNKARAKHLVELVGRYGSPAWCPDGGRR